MTDLLTVARVRNPDASRGLELTVLLDCNTSSEAVNSNIRSNSRQNLPWLGFSPAHSGVAVIVGGGPSVADDLDKIKGLSGSSFIVALNGASSWLRSHGVRVDCQCIMDARPENIDLLDKQAVSHLFASQVDPALLCVTPTLMHLLTPGVEDLLPKERRDRGNYALLGGGYGVGNTAICAASVMGYRTIHCFGFDSSHRNGKGHAYAQPMNDSDVLVDTEWEGETYTSSLGMKAQAERFQIIASDLEYMGCNIHVHGSGLLPAMWRTRDKQLTEKSKYHCLWSTQSYREVSPGEHAVDQFLSVVKPDGLVIDFGCGTGRAALKMHKAGLGVHLVDFAENCRDAAAVGLPFLECDLTQPIPLSAPFGFCSDVMEHIPPFYVRTVIKNIMAAADRVFFQIDTRPDTMGGLIGKILHLSVHPAPWWRGLFDRLGYVVEWEDRGETSVRFVVATPERIYGHSGTKPERSLAVDYPDRVLC